MDRDGGAIGPPPMLGRVGKGADMASVCSGVGKTELKEDRAELARNGDVNWLKL